MRGGSENDMYLANFNFCGGVSSASSGFFWGAVAKKGGALFLTCFEDLSILLWTASDRTSLVPNRDLSYALYGTFEWDNLIECIRGWMHVKVSRAQMQMSQLRSSSSMETSGSIFSALSITNLPLSLFLLPTITIIFLSLPFWFGPVKRDWTAAVDFTRVIKHACFIAMCLQIVGRDFDQLPRSRVVRQMRQITAIKIGCDHWFECRVLLKDGVNLDNLDFI